MRFLLYAAAAAALAPPQQHSAALDAVEYAIDAAVASTSQPIEALPPAERVCCLGRVDVDKVHKDGRFPPDWTVSLHYTLHEEEPPPEEELS